LVVPLTVVFVSHSDDKGRVRWTLFGPSEQGPAKGFWQSFYQGPEEEYPIRKLSSLAVVC